MSSLWRSLGFNFARDDIAVEASGSLTRLFQNARGGTPSSPQLRGGTIEELYAGGWLDLAASEQRGTRDDLLVEMSRLAGYFRVPLSIAAVVIPFACAENNPSITPAGVVGADLNVGLGWRMRSGEIVGVPVFSGATAAIVLSGDVATPFGLSRAQAMNVIDQSCPVVLLGKDTELDGPWEVLEGTASWLGAVLPFLVAADAVGAAERAWELARDHVTTRQQFGGVLADLQAVRQQLAEAATVLVAARSLLASISALETDVSSAVRDASVDLILNHAEAAATAATHLHGALGYTAEHEVGWCRMRVAANRGLIRRSQREQSLA